MLFKDGKQLVEQLQQNAVVQNNFELRDALSQLLTDHGIELEGIPLQQEEDIFADLPVSPLNIVVEPGAFG